MEHMSSAAKIGRLMLRRLQVIKQQLADGVKTRRVGFVSKGAPARAHSEIQTPEGETVRHYPAALLQLLAPSHTLSTIACHCVLPQAD